MSGKDFMPFEEPPKKKVERQPSWESVKQNPAMQEDPRMRPQPPIRYTEAMKKRWGPPSAESLEVEEARRKDPSLKVSFSFDPKTGMVGLKRTDPAQAAAAQPTAGMIGQQPKSQPEGATLEQDPKGSVPTVAPNQIAQTPQPTPSSQPSRVNHDRKPDPVPFIESNIPIIGRHQLWGSKGDDMIWVKPTKKPGIYEVTVTSVDKDSGENKIIGKRLLTEDQLNRTDIHGGKGDDRFIVNDGKLPPGTKFYGDAGDDDIARSRENRGIAFDGGKGNDAAFDEGSRIHKSDGKPGSPYERQSEIEWGSPEESVHNFIRKVAKNAEKRLANNSARLQSEQKGYENLNPSNRKWSQLRELAQQDQQLVAYKNRLTDQISALQIKDRQSSPSSPNPLLFPDPFLSPNTNSISERPNTFPGLKNAYPIGVINPQTQAKIEELKAQQNLITLAQRQRQAQYPALAVLDTAVVAKTANTPQGNQALLNTIGKGFGKIQGSIAELQDQILEDPERAMALDDVRNRTLQEYQRFLNTKDPKDQPKAEAIKGYLKTRELQKLGGDILTGGLTVGAVIGTVLAPEAMWPLWVGAAGTAAGVATGIRDYREFSTVDLAAQAQQGGAGSLTSKSKEEARFDLIMGQANLLMAGLDVGMTAKGTVGLIKGSTKMGASLSKVKPAALAQVLNDVANGQLEKARAGLEAAGKFSKNEVDETLRWIQNLDSGNMRLAADGVPGGALDEVKPTNNQKGKGTAGGGPVGASAKPIQVADNLSNEAAEKLLAKYPQWNEVKDYIGRPFDPNNLPPGYKDRVKNGRPELYRDSTEGPFPPLTVKNGIVMLQTGKSARLSVFSRYKKNYLNWLEETQGKVARVAAEKRLVDGNQLHHLTPDAVVQSNDLTKELMRRSKKYTLDRGSNILDMPTLHNPKTGEIVHLGSHDNFNEYADELLNQQIEKLTRNRAIPLEKVKVNDLDKAVRQVEDTLREQIKNRTLPRDILEPLEGGGFKISEGNQNDKGDKIV
jgi:A nuclease family of the HNH/ENDO VII superfamily with conserved AHH